MAVLAQHQMALALCTRPASPSSYLRRAGRDRQGLRALSLRSAFSLFSCSWILLPRVSHTPTRAFTVADPPSKGSSSPSCPSLGRGTTCLRAGMPRDAWGAPQQQQGPPSPLGDLAGRARGQRVSQQAGQCPPRPPELPWIPGTEAEGRRLPCDSRRWNSWPASSVHPGEREGPRASTGDPC